MVPMLKHYVTSGRCTSLLGCQAHWNGRGQYQNTGEHPSMAKLADRQENLGNQGRGNLNRETEEQVVRKDSKPMTVSKTSLTRMLRTTPT